MTSIEAHDWSVKFSDALVVANQSNITDVRWIIHGHITFKLIWEAFQRCFYVVGKKKVKSGPSFDLETHSRNCSGVWALLSKNGEAEYPQEVIRLLGLSV